ncbi:uncharacterized protein [Diadema setosum]|uniref:uncharacterized protein n=1 Tax=Diadema setosum TaxID=31175 RepID=UPI003B3B3162
MSSTGFQPVCVLYQGNNSPFDGTCQLVCRHQIQEEEFNQGDVVQVSNLPAGGNDGNQDSSEARQAIIMGREMVSSLVGTLFGTTVKKKSNKRPHSEVDEASHTNEENDTLLHEILATVKDIRSEVVKQGLELANIKKHQKQLDAKMTLLTNSIPSNSGWEEFAESSTLVPAKAVGKGEAAATAPSEVQGEMVETENGEIVTVKAEPCWSDSSDENMDGESSTCEVSRVSEIASGDEEGVSSAKYTSFAAPMSNQSYLTDALAHATQNKTIELGTPHFKVVMTVSEFEDIVYKANNASSFAYRLANKCFTVKEMIEGNTRGGGMRSNGRIFKQLNPDAIDMIIAEVKKIFPNSASDRVLTRCVKNAINERCRNVRKKLNRTMLVNPNVSSELWE